MILEQLLNKLIEKGWKPFGGPYYDRFIIERDGDMCFRWKYPGTDGTHSYDYNFDYFKIRELTSKESGLWQFICYNGMRPKRVGYEEHYWQRDNHTNGRGMVMESEPEYRIIESALCNEEDLEEFLLDNIKI